MLVMPSLDMVRRNTTVRIDPLIEGDAALRELVAAAPAPATPGTACSANPFPRWPAW